MQKVQEKSEDFVDDLMIFQLLFFVVDKKQRKQGNGNGPKELFEKTPGDLLVILVKCFYQKGHQTWG